MDNNFSKYREQQGLIPIKIENKEKYYSDLVNLEGSWTGRMDALIGNTFILEAVQLLINSIVLFEKGYFDAAFYSLRQSLELTTTMTYLIDNDEDLRKKELEKWKDQSRFPMYNQMVQMLEKNESVFADIKTQMHNYFEGLKQVKQKLNKYVHKQGFNTFYVSKNHPFNHSKDRSKFLNEFETYLKQCIGAVAVFRLTIDPFPILLNDQDIYVRTSDLVTYGYSDEFIENYIGKENIAAYKKTEVYQNHYDSIIQEEPKSIATTDVVKNQFIDKSKIDEILKQSHLLSQHDLVAIVLCNFSEKISKIYAIGGLLMYFTSTKSKREKMEWSGMIFKEFEESTKSFNLTFDEVFISTIELHNHSYFMEHNEPFDEKEIEQLEIVKTLHTTMGKKNA